MKKACITGASSGIGRELAHLLAAKGVDLILHGRNRFQLNRLYDELSKQVQVRLCEAELASQDGVDALLKIVEEEMPDVVINNAGFGLFGDLLTQPPQEVEQMIEANCVALVRICQHVARLWRTRGIYGTILNVSSVVAYCPTPGAAVYAATKAFVSSFSEALNTELNAYGISVLVSCPGRVATHFAERASKGHETDFRPGGMVLSPKSVAQSMLKQIEKGEPVSIIDWKYRILLFIKNIFPKKLVMSTIYKVRKSRAGQ